MSRIDEVYKNLGRFDGSINDRVYAYLGSLGYTGSMNDRLSKYEFNGEKGLIALLKEYGEFLPLQLFSQGQEGVWYDPSDLSTLYQDSAGTLQVETTGDPVGLILDKRYGLERGPESVVNGTFDTNLDGWDTSSAWVWDAGAAAITDAPSDTTYLMREGVGEPGKTYEVSFDILAADGSVEVRFGAASPSESYTRFSGVGTHKAVLPWNGLNSNFYIRRTAAGGHARVDNISVRELPGNHATQPTSASRATYPGLIYDGVDDALSSDYPATDVMGEFTISAAIRLLDLGVSDGYFFAMGSSSSTVPIFGINANNSRGITFVVRRDDGTVWQPTGIPLDTDYHVATCVIGSGNVEFFVDGVSVASTASGGSLTVDQVAMGALPRPTNVAHLNAEVAGGVCLSRAVTPGERASLENYLDGKAGVTL